MRATFRNYMDAVKARREENGDAGFSLIELIVVVVILGVLAAIAIPVFAGLQSQSEERALETVAANAATAGASQVALGLDGAALTTALNAEATQLTSGSITVTISGTSIETICAEAAGTVGGAAMTKAAGPGVVAGACP